MNIFEITTFDHVETKTLPTYGGKRTHLMYYVETLTNGIKNRYNVEAVLRGQATASVYLDFTDAQHLDNNEETLTEDAIIAKVEEYVG